MKKQGIFGDVIAHLLDESNDWEKWGREARKEYANVSAAHRRFVARTYRDAARVLREFQGAEVIRCSELNHVPAKWILGLNDTIKLGGLLAAARRRAERKRP